MIYHPPPATRTHPGTTPPPTYAEDTFTGTQYPTKLPVKDHNRARRAMTRARQLYPGVIGEFLAKEIGAYTEFGWLAREDTPIAKVIDHLLRQPLNLPDNVAGGALRVITIVLLVAALVCFLLATFGLPTRINVGWLGAALITITLIIGNWPGVGVGD